MAEFRTKSVYSIGLMKVLGAVILTLFAVSCLIAGDPTPDYFLHQIVGISKSEIVELEGKAKDGDPKAQLLVGLLKMRSHNSTKRAYENPREGILLIQKSADQGYAPAAYFVVSLCQDQVNGGIVGSEPCQKMDAYLEKGIAKSYPAAIWYKGYFSERQKPKQKKA